MPTQPSFAPIARSLRDEVIGHYERTGTPLATEAGRRTLDTNSTLAADRGRLLLRVLAEAGAGPVAGRRVLDLGAGFGALSVYFAHLGAEVVAVDPHEDRMGVGIAVARRYGLAVNSVPAHGQALPLPDAAFHIAVVNNSLCYVVDSASRHAALAELARVLLPGAWVVMRDPNRLAIVDPFTGVPILAMLPPRLSQRAARGLRRHRSDVRLRTPFGAVHELRRAGFTQVRWHPVGGRRLASRSRLAPYHHVVARRSE